jgi:ubiquitin carboxyl-terminal hydrolase 4/11/15
MAMEVATIKDDEASTANAPGGAISREKAEPQEVEVVVENDDVSSRILSAKDIGNQHYSKGSYPEALECYRAGLDLITGAEQDSKDLEVALRSNVAQCLLMMEKFEAAQEECDIVLTCLDPTNAKVWYRRALAREHLGLFHEALGDVQMSLKHINASFPPSPLINTMKRAAQRALDRIQQHVEEDATLVEACDGASTSETNGPSAPQRQLASSNSNRPLPKQQRHNVAQLLTNNHPTLEGEALFLLNWNWWTTWCDYVDFYSSQEYLSLLPPGAMLPKKQQKEEKEQDDSSDSSDSVQEQQPREIDNSILLESRGSLFHVQGLKPNLVRGHHYELIPREVYNALRIWYGEVTPSICRRVSIRQAETVAKLPLYVDPPCTPRPPANKHCCGACRAPAGIKRCKQCLLIYYCSRSCQESHWYYHKAYCKQGKPPSPLSAGLVGLNNLGNTCFLNSALQCLSHATPLTRHFLSNRFKKDVNEANPLGTRGELAFAYEKVIKDIWLSSHTSTTPTTLKISIAKFAPRFGGCNQHDAQEFLAYLLDGLHEDLNRVRHAPYVKMPDVVGSNWAISAEEAWDAHRCRNDSLIFDTFYGQFKSTCVCPKCERVSVSFDAFNHVSLELPQWQDQMRTLFILVFRLGEGEPCLPTRYGVTVKRGSLGVNVQQALSELCGIPSERLAICDVCENSIYEILNDNKPVSTIRASDVLTAYEVDPYADTTIHAIATHALVLNENNNKSNTEATTELEASAEMAEEESLEAFGFPFLTSFNSQLTCREVWEHVWKVVKNVVAPEFSKGADDNSLRSLLRIRIVDNTGASRPVFLDDVDVSANDKGIDRASILPPVSDEKVMKYLGKGCAGHFLFLRLEWLDTASTSPEHETKEEVSPEIDKERFLCFENHSSLMEAQQNMRATNGVKAGVTLDQCFEAFSKPERLDENNMWYCSKCKEHVRAMKTMELWRLPNILVVHLKRFEFKHILRRDKLDTLVDFPLDALDMSKHCASARNTNATFVEDSVPATYDLFAVTNHYGRMGFGHYTAFARRWDEQGISNEWALFDDSSVRSVGDGTGRAGRNDGVVTSAAYVLFYRRRIN